MTLKQYRKAHGLTQKQLAKRLGYSQAYLSEAEGGAPVGRAFIVKVLSETGGEVPASEWLPAPPGSQQPAPQGEAS